MYLYEAEAMKGAYWKGFITAMVKEVTDQMNNGDYYITPKSQVKTGSTILPVLWKMKHKRDIKKRYFKKWKARLNIDGYRIKRGFNTIIHM